MNETETKPLVLFLCTGNSARSQMAEAVLRRRAGNQFRVASAGLKPVGVNPFAIQVLAEWGIDIANARSKNLSEFLAKSAVRYAIILCESAHAACPHVYPFANNTLYWPFDDPAQPHASPSHQLEKFREVRDQIAQRIDMWLHELNPSPQPDTLCVDV